MHRLIRALALGLLVVLSAASASLLPASPAIAAFANIVKFTAASSGTSDFSDGTAPTGFLNLSNGAVSGQAYSYRAYSADLSQWEDGRGTYTSGSPGTLSRTTIYESSTGSKISFSTAPVVILTPLKADMDAFGSVASVAISAGTGISTSGTCTITTSGTCTVGLSTPVGVANGGTGSTSLTANNVLLGNGTSALQTVPPGTAGNVLRDNGITWVSDAPITMLSPATTTSGTSWTWTLPGTEHIIWIQFAGFSTNGTSNPIVQIGNGTVATSGYVSASQTGSSVSSSTSGFMFRQNTATQTSSGIMTLMLESSSNTWVESHSIAETGQPLVWSGGGSVTLGGTATILKLTMTNGTDAGDAGQVNVSYQ